MVFQSYLSLVYVAADFNIVGTSGLPWLEAVPFPILCITPCYNWYNIVDKRIFQ